MKFVDIEDLPPCSFSPECLRLMDDTDLLENTYVSGELTSIDDLRVERRVRWLRAHVDGCVTCSTLLADARNVRATQRKVLHHLLLASETQVPSTTEAIFASLRHEPFQEEKSWRRDLYNLDPNVIYPEVWRDDTPMSPLISLRRHFFQSVLTLTTIVAMLLVAVGLFNHFSDVPGTSSTLAESHAQIPLHSNSVAQGSGWDSVVIGLTLLSTTELMKGFTFYTYDAVRNRLMTQMMSSQFVMHVSMDGLSSDGQSLLYETTSLDQQTTYALFSPLVNSSIFYHADSTAGSGAIWMDATHVLMQQNGTTVSEVDTQNGLTQRSWPLKSVKLSFYHKPFLYVVGEVGLGKTALYRLDLFQPGAILQQVAIHASHTRFWLSDDGAMVFYADEATNEVAGIYEVNSDGTHKRLLHEGSGIPIGVVANNALMVLQQVGSKVEVLKIGTSPGGQEQVVMSDVAPYAVSLCGPSVNTTVIVLCDANIALSPYGRGLLLHSYYADGSHGLVYDDLTTGTSHKIFNLPGGASVQLPGWSKWSDAASPTSSAVTALCA